MNINFENSLSALANEPTDLVLWSDLLDAFNDKVSSEDYTDTKVLTKVLTVDGTGSGLDADKLDGIEGTLYARKADPTFSGTVTTPSLIVGDLTGNYIPYQKIADDKLSDSPIFTDGTHLGIGTATPNVNTVLDLTSTTKAFMLPCMTTAQRDLIAVPTEGMLIFNLTTHVLNYRGVAAWAAV